ncbi:MAG: phenylacetate-CoA oxygenase subunit PaaJ [Nevskia sp.]|nr:phenylacetate-CoA oxygenase subunit PaaJ [Nevskia sp.]
MAAVEEQARAEPAQVWDWLAQVPDPEIPAISLVDLGIVRNVRWVAGAGGDELEVTITPTYSGCPATEVIAASIREMLAAHGLGSVRLRQQLSPAWTTDWISAAGRGKLAAYGIAPPHPCSAGAAAEQAVDASRILRRAAPRQVRCPRCDSAQTQLVSEFGSTPCKALYRCQQCLEPFDYFKPH